MFVYIVMCVANMQLLMYKIDMCHKNNALN
jgi:hypothetical protein